MVKRIVLFVVLFATVTGGVFLFRLHINKVQISEEDAIKIVADAIGADSDSKTIEVDGIKSESGKDFYVVHVYSLSPPLDEEGLQMTFTYNWYNVDIYSGELFPVFPELLQIQ